MTEVGAIQQLISVFMGAIDGLEARMSLKETEELAVMIHRIMTVQARNYHTLEHVFDLIDPADPIQTLAALFHDLVYYQVDCGIPPDVYDLVSSYLEEKEAEIFIASEIAHDDRLAELTLDIFGLSMGDKLWLPDGLNEFASALFMNKKLSGYISEKDLLKVTVCIEATIPFRGSDKQGKSHFEVLEKRLRTTCIKYEIPMDNEEIEETITKAVIFANSDVKSFCEESTGVFLDSTWKLLPESNIALRPGEIYSVRDFRMALQKTMTFMSSLNPENIFHQYNGVPAETEYRHMVRNTIRNLCNAQGYLRVKLVAMAILEALADISGGDAPLPLFMGDVYKDGQNIKRLEDYLPRVETSPVLSDESEIVFQLLNNGRTIDSTFDTKNSPLSLFIFQSIGPENIPPLYEHAKSMFRGDMLPEEFLEKLDKGLAGSVARACASMVLTRQEALLGFARSLEVNA